MITVLKSLFPAGLACAFLLVGSAWSEPAAYELLLSHERSVSVERITGLFERNLPQVNVLSILPSERYRRYAHLPVALCIGPEYFAFAHGKRLIAFGCLDDSSAAKEVQKIRRILAREREIVRERRTDALYDAALDSAAAGEWAQARRYADGLRLLPQADRAFALRLQRLLTRQK